MIRAPTGTVPVSSTEFAPDAWKSRQVYAAGEHNIALNQSRGILESYQVQSDLLQALYTLLSVQHLMFLLGGTLLGLVVGFLPGLGGIAALSLLLPFVYGGDPTLVLPSRLSSRLATRRRL